MAEGDPDGTAIDEHRAADALAVHELAKPKRAIRSLGALALVVASLAVVGSAARADSSQEADLAARVNALRASRGLSQLVVDERIATVARNWASRMAGDSSLPHNPNLGGELPPGWKVYAENVAYAVDTASIQDWWEHSPPHLSNMLMSDITHMGIGVVQLNGYLWAVEDFAGYRTASPSPEPTTTPTSSVASNDGSFSASPPPSVSAASYSQQPSSLDLPSAAPESTAAESSPPAWAPVVATTTPEVTWASVGSSSSTISSRVVGQVSMAARRASHRAASTDSRVDRKALVATVALLVPLLLVALGQIRARTAP